MKGGFFLISVTPVPTDCGLFFPFSEFVSLSVYNLQTPFFVPLSEVVYGKDHSIPAAGVGFPAASVQFFESVVRSGFLLACVSRP